MTTRYKTQAFVFKKNDRSESDRIFSVFTDDFGRLDIFAKAVRKTESKLRGGIDIFFLSDIEFIQGKTKKTLTSASAIKKFNNVSHDLEKFSTAHGIGKILDNFITGEEKDKDVFNLLREVFYKLDDRNLKSEKSQLAYYYFLWNAFSLFGYHPEVQQCNCCRQKLDPYNIYFSNKAGGVICKKCSGQDSDCLKINSDVVKILRILFNKDWQVIARLKVDPSSQKLFQEVSNNYYSYICQKKQFI